MIEVNKSAGGIGGRAGNDGINNDGAVWSLIAGGDVERVQSVSLAARFLGAGNDKERAACKVDCGCAADANFTDECAAIWSDIRRRRDRDPRGRVDKAGAPQGLRVRADVGIGVEGINAVVHRGDKDNVVGAFAGNREVRDVKRLGVNGAIHPAVVDFAEAVDVDVYGSQVGFVGIKAGAGIVVVAGKDVYLRVRHESHAENQK